MVKASSLVNDLGIVDSSSNQVTPALTVNSDNQGDGTRGPLSGDQGHSCGKAIRTPPPVSLKESLKEPVFISLFSSLNLNSLLFTRGNIFSVEDSKRKFPVETKPQAQSRPPTIQATITDRDGKYGNFERQAGVAQKIKEAFFLPDEHVVMLPADMCESLDMIATKLSRIICGDHKLIDNWHDIAGYATLIEQRLIKEQAKEQANG